MMLVNKLLRSVPSNRRSLQEKEFYRQGLYEHNFTYAGDYVSNLTRISASGNFYIYLKADVFKVYVTDTFGVKMFLADIETNKVTGITIESVVKSSARVIIAWGDDNRTVFEFNGKSSITKAGRLYSRLINIKKSTVKVQDDLHKNLREYLRNGDKPAAIALYKSATGTPLVESKEYIEYMIA